MNAGRDIIIGRVLAVGAALISGTTAVLIRQGVADLAPPVVGAAIALLSGTLVLGVIEVGSANMSLRREKRSVGFLLLAGVASGIAIMANYSALSIAPVVIVTPVANTSPLFVLLWAHLFLGKLERITLRIVFGTILVVVGVILIAIGRVA